MSSDDSNFVESDALDELDAVSAVDYDDDAFDNYSDSFESDGGSNDGDGDGDRSAAAASSASADASNTSACESSRRYELDERVQVYWQHEREWFSGTVAQCDDSRGTRRYFVEYDDGEAQWETSERMRCVPEAADFELGGFQQLQLLMPTSSTSVDLFEDAVCWLLGAKVLVYWRDSASWFPGSITEVDVQVRALRVEYDDGDERWEQDRDFVDILVHIPTSLAANMSAEATATAPVPAVTPTQQYGQTPPPPAPIERVLTPRAYIAVVERHFQPERTSRPYVSVTTTIGSILTPRKYCERRYLHAKLECALSETTNPGDKQDALVQTDVPGAMDMAQRVYSPCR